MFLFYKKGVFNEFNAVLTEVFLCGIALLSDFDYSEILHILVSIISAYLKTCVIDFICISFFGFSCVEKVFKTCFVSSVFQHIVTQSF